MAFSQSTITAGPIITFDGSDYNITWTSSSASGTCFQVYINSVLAYSGIGREFQTPFLAKGSSVVVGTVGDTETRTNFSGSLPSITGAKKQAKLTWFGGRYEGETLAGFRIYMSTVAGGSVGSVAVAEVLAVQNGQWEDGFGVGRFGKGGFGRSEISYSWISGYLGNGTWNFVVKPYDQAGNEGTASMTTSASVASMPSPPAIGGDGKRISYQYNATTRAAVISWNTSTG